MTVKDEKNRKKALLPVVTWNGTFKSRHKTWIYGDINQIIWNVLEKCCVEFNKKLENFRKI